MDKARRHHARFPSDLSVEVFSGPVAGVRIGEGVLIDISLSGCLMRVRGLMRTGWACRLRVKWRDGMLDLPGRVARDAGPSNKDPAASHYGIAFNLTGGQEKDLMRLIEIIRLTVRPGDDRFLRNYWG